MDTIEAMIFDVDGTLVDSVPQHAEAWRQALADFGYAVELADVAAQIGKGGDKLMAEFVPATELSSISERLDAHRASLFKARFLAELRGFPRVRELFERLKAGGKRLALASSAKGDELEHYKRLVHVEDLLDGDASSDDAKESKPAPDIFEAALAAVGKPPAACLVIGDSPWDALAATKAGIPAVGVRCGGFPESVLLGAGYVRLYDDPQALLQAYDRVGDDAFRAPRR
jgi:phosphoglycolate phosphatase-like HAD superfamily hydrolase